MPVTAIADADIDVAYAAAGLDGGLVVLLVHGWPDDASTWDEVASQLTAAGYRTIVPSLRGFGETRFRSKATPRIGNSDILKMRSG